MMSQKLMAQGSAGIGTSAPSSTSTSTQPDLNKSKELDPEKECCICIIKERSIAFVPCGHAVCCSDCGPKLKDCPVCRKKIKTRLQLFFS